MKHIELFVAGSITLEEERKEIDALIGSLNSLYYRNGFNITVSSYKTLGSDQREYDTFIKRRAEVVVLIIKGVLGERAEGELKLALDTKEKHYHPKVAIYVNSDEEKGIKLDAESNKRLDDILNMGETNYYYTLYKNNAELTSLIKDCVLAYIHDYGKIKRKVFWRRWRVPICCFVGAAVVAFGCYLINQINKQNNQINMQKGEIDELSKPRLVVAGGGTVYNYIKHGYSINGDTVGRLDIANPQNTQFKNVYYVHIPSGNAYSLLNEERITPTNYCNLKRYYPVCLSTGKANVTDFVSSDTNDYIKNVGHIVGIEIGEVKLMVLEYNPAGKKNNNTFSPQELMRMIDNNEVILHTTSPNSGTYNAYTKQMGLTLMSKPLVFSDAYYYSSDKDTTDVKKHLDTGKINIFMANESYLPKISDEIKEKTDTMYVIKPNGDPASMPLYIYFVAYRSKVDPSRCVIKKEIMSMLQAIDFDIQDSIIKPGNDTTLVVYRRFPRK